MELTTMFNRKKPLHKILSSPSSMASELEAFVDETQQEMRRVDEERYRLDEQFASLSNEHMHATVVKAKIAALIEG